MCYGAHPLLHHTALTNTIGSFIIPTSRNMAPVRTLTDEPMEPWFQGHGFAKMKRCVIELPTKLIMDLQEDGNAALVDWTTNAIFGTGTFVFGLLGGKNLNQPNVSNTMLRKISRLYRMPSVF